MNDCGLGLQANADGSDLLSCNTVIVSHHELQFTQCRHVRGSILASGNFSLLTGTHVFVAQVKLRLLRIASALSIPLPDVKQLERKERPSAVVIRWV